MAFDGMTKVQSIMIDLLSDTQYSPLLEANTGVSSHIEKTAEDELFDALLEKITEDASDGPKQNGKSITLQEHDKKHHPNGFDPNTMHCKFRDELKKKDSADLLYATSDVHYSGIEDIDDTESGTIVLAGDFMEKAKHQADFPSAEKWWEETFKPWCDKHSHQQIVIIGGNCDKWLYGNRDKIEWPANVHYLDDTETEVNGMKVYGTSWCPHNMNGAWEVDDEQLEKEFAKIPEGLDILVTHVPPKGDGIELDHDTKFNNHFGSEALTKAILEKKPKIVLCGHVHSGSHKPVKIGDSIVMNVARVDDDRYEKAFHGRRIGVERTDNGLGFLVDMEDDGKIDFGKKEDVPESILKMRDTLRDAAKSINAHIEKKDYRPDKKKIQKAKDAIEAAMKDMDGFEHPRKEMLENGIKSFQASEKSGFKKKMDRIGKIFAGDRNGEDEKFHYSWESPWGKGSYYGGMFGGGGLGDKPLGFYTGQNGRYNSPWKGGMAVDDIIAGFGKTGAYSKRNQALADLRSDDYETNVRGARSIIESLPDYVGIREFDIVKDTAKKPTCMFLAVKKNEQNQKLGTKGIERELKLDFAPEGYWVTYSHIGSEEVKGNSVFVIMKKKKVLGKNK